MNKASLHLAYQHWLSTTTQYFITQNGNSRKVSKVVPCLFPNVDFIWIGEKRTLDWSLLVFHVTGIKEKGKKVNYNYKPTLSDMWRGKSVLSATTQILYLLKNIPLMIQTDTGAISYHWKTDNLSQINLVLNKQKSLSHWPRLKDDLWKNVGIRQYMT